MAIASNNQQTPAATTAAASKTLSYTMSGAGTLEVKVMLWDNGGNRVVSGVTYDGVSMTQRGSGVRVSDGPANYIVYLFSLESVSAKTANIVVTVDSTCDVIQMIARYLTGTDENGPEVIATFVQDASSPFQVSLTTLSDNAWISALLGVWHDGTAVAASSPLGTAYGPSNAATPDGGFAQFYAADMTKATAGAQTLGWTTSGDFGPASLGAVAYKEAGGGGGGGGQPPRSLHQAQMRRVA